MSQIIVKVGEAWQHRVRDVVVFDQLLTQPPPCASVLDGPGALPLSSDYHPHTAYSRGQREAAAQASGDSYARNGATIQVSPARVLMGDGPRSGRRQRRRAPSSTTTAAPASKSGRVRLNINEVACAG